MKEKYTRVSAYGLVTHDSKILLCRISKQLPRWQGQWTLPGGGIDFGEPTFEIEGTTDRCEWFGLQEAKALPLVGLVKIGLNFVTGDKG